MVHSSLGSHVIYIDLFFSHSETCGNVQFPDHTRNTSAQGGGCLLSVVITFTSSPFLHYNFLYHQSHNTDHHFKLHTPPPDTRTLLKRVHATNVLSRRRFVQKWWREAAAAGRRPAGGEGSRDAKPTAPPASPSFPEPLLLPPITSSLPSLLLPPYPPSSRNPFLPPPSCYVSPSLPPPTRYISASV